MKGLYSESQTCGRTKSWMSCLSKMVLMHNYGKWMCFTKRHERIQDNIKSTHFCGNQKFEEFSLKDAVKVKVKEIEQSGENFVIRARRCLWQR